MLATTERTAMSFSEVSGLLWQERESLELLLFKLVLVVALSAMHGNLSMSLRRACAPEPVVPARVWRATPALATAGRYGPTTCDSAPAVPALRRVISASRT